MTVAGTVVMIAVPTMAAAMTAMEIVETTGVTTAPATAGMSVAMIAVAVQMVDAVRDTAVATAGRTDAGMIAPGEIAMIVGRTEIVTTTDAMTAEAGLTTAVPTMTVVVAPMHARTSAGMIVVTTAVQPVGVVTTAAGIAVMTVLAGHDGRKDFREDDRSGGRRDDRGRGNFGGDDRRRDADREERMTRRDLSGDLDKPRFIAPDIDEDVTGREIDKPTRRQLEALEPRNAERVAQHLVMAARYLDVDAEFALEHANAAVRKAGQIAVVREATGVAAYAAGDYALALKELRTHRRISGSEALAAHRGLPARFGQG